MAMLLKVKGFPHHIMQPIVAPVTRDMCRADGNTVLIAENYMIRSGNFRAVLTNLPAEDHESYYSAVFSIANLDHLAEGDIVLINTNGVINTLYRVASRQNFLMVTGCGNSNHTIGPQPLKGYDETPYLYQINRQLIPLIPKDCVRLGITGGEPTLLGDYFFYLLRQIQEELPDTEVHCLTNGRFFARPVMAKRLGALQMRRLVLDVPLSADHYAAQDYIMQANDAFCQTALGLQNLAAQGIRLELRVVLHKQTVPQLMELARFICKNMPFAEHITFIGPEYQGYAPFNEEKLWIDPANYMSELGEAVQFLDERGMHVSIYNSQPSLMPEILWRFNTQSILDWEHYVY